MVLYGLGAIYWVLSLLQLGIIFGDAALHLDGARNWLRGADPWSAGSAYFHFAAPPAILVPLAPFALLGPLGLPLWMALTIACAVSIQRRHRLDPMWLLFPPLVQGVLLGNPIVLAVALVGTRLEGLVPLIRAQLAVVLLQRPRSLAAAAALLIVTFPILPWLPFLERLSQISARYAIESGSASAWGTPLAIPTAIALVGLAAVDRSAALWLVVPAISPASGYYNGILAMPLRSLWLGAVLALPIAGAPAVGTIAYAIVRVIGRLRDRRAHARADGAAAQAHQRGARITDR